MKQFYVENSRRNSTTLILLVKADLCIIKFYRYKEYQSTGGTSGLASNPLPELPVLLKSAMIVTKTMTPKPHQKRYPVFWLSMPLRKGKKNDGGNTPRIEMRKYFEDLEDDEDGSITTSTTALRFWKMRQGKYPALSKLALILLTVPASSAPVERVFSSGGILMRPHRARLSSAMLEKLIFLKCNMKLSIFD